MAIPNGSMRVALVAAALAGPAVAGFMFRGTRVNMCNKAVPCPDRCECLAASYCLVCFVGSCLRKV